jgi:hypothetical protein
MKWKPPNDYRRAVARGMAKSESDERAREQRSRSLWLLMNVDTRRLTLPAKILGLAATVVGLVGMHGQLAGLQINSAHAASKDTEISARRAAERKNFSDAEIAEGFFKIAFGAEFHVGGVTDRIRKYDVPIRILVANRGKPDRRQEVTTVVNDIRAHLQHLDLELTDDVRGANVMVTLVRDRDLMGTLRAMYGRRQAKEIQLRLNPQCLSSFRKDGEFRIRHSDAILVVDAGDFKFYDCAYEELLQALGPINDDRSVPWTMFNDDVQMGFFDVYDQYLLNILYDPRIRPGMTRDQVRALLPEVMPAVRAWVEDINALVH